MCGYHSIKCAAICGVLSLGSLFAAFAQDATTSDYYYNGINRSPWFGNRAVRDQLGIDEARYQRMSRDYTSSWNRYHQSLNSLNSDLSEEKRLLRQQELSGDFHQNFSRTRDEVLTDAAARERYNQLHLQYRTYGSFDDPEVRNQLKLTTEQLQTFRQHDRQWNRDMRTWERDYPTNAELVLKRYNESRSEYNERVKSDLTPEQLRTYSNLVGKPHNFGPDAYFPTAPESKIVRPALK